MKKILIILGIALVLVAIVLAFIPRSPKIEIPQNTSDANQFPSQNPSGQNTGLNNSNGSVGNSNQNQNSDQNFVPNQNENKNVSGDVNTGTQKRALIQISDKPVAGATSFGTIKKVNLTARYLERGTGHVYDFKPLGASRVRISGATIPKVQSVLWGNRGQSALLSLLNDSNITNPTSSNPSKYLVRFPSTVANSAETKLEGQYLTANILAAVTSPEGDERVACPALLNGTLRKDAPNDPSEVKKLQAFLKSEGETLIRETGIYDASTTVAVIVFQEKYTAQILTPNGLTKGSGIVGQSTRDYINMLNCQKSGSRVTGDRFFFLGTTDTGSAYGAIADFDTGKINQIFSSPLSEFRLAWPSSNTLILATKPSVDIMGGAYLFNKLNTNAPVQLVDNIESLINILPGLMISVNPDTKIALFARSSSRQFSTYLLNVASGKERIAPINTLPQDKCVWSHLKTSVIYCAVPSEDLPSNLPDSWYLGKVIFNDAIYKIDTQTDSVTLLHTPDPNNQIDILSPFLAEDESFLFFTNKLTNLLWALPLSP